MATVTPSVSAVIPTLGASPWLASTLASLRRSAGDAQLELIVVDQGTEPVPREHVVEADQVIRLDVNLGFAGGTNAGIEAAQGDWIATVNDDVLVMPDWLPALLEAIAVRPDVVAVQGINLRWQPPSEPASEPKDKLILPLEEAPGTRADGAGIAWNRWLQALQIDHGEVPESPTAPPHPVFGVSATAALYRRSALETVRLTGGASKGVFDGQLESYYEDVDLACRLRQCGTAWTVPAARAWHAASTTGKTRPRRRLRQLYGNRHLVLARALGRSYGLCLPRLLLRDVGDLVGSPVRADLRGTVDDVTGILSGWMRALRHLPSYIHFGQRLDDLFDSRFRRDA